jgi:hypothetical protein
MFKEVIAGYYKKLYTTQILLKSTGNMQSFYLMLKQVWYIETTLA